MRYTKAACAKFFRISLTGMDAWIARGCPHDTNSRGHVSGMYVGDVIEWGLENPSPEVKKRAREAAQMQIALIIVKAAFSAGDYEGILRAHGLDERSAKKAWDEIRTVAGHRVAAITNAPLNVLS